MMGQRAIFRTAWYLYSWSVSNVWWAKELYLEQPDIYIPDQEVMNDAFTYWSGVDFTKSRKSKINRKCDFQAFDWLKFTLTTDLRLTTFCEIDHRLPLWYLDTLY
jgi:hypothetical protein